MCSYDLETIDNCAPRHCDVILAKGGMSGLLARLCRNTFIPRSKLRTPSTAYLLPLTAASLLFAVAALGFRATKRRGYHPMLLGLFGSAAVLMGKFSLDSSAVRGSAWTHNSFVVE